MEEKKKDSLRSRWEHMTKDKFLVLFLFGVLLLVIAWPTKQGSSAGLFSTVQEKAEGEGMGAESLPERYDSKEYESSNPAGAYANQLEQALEEVLSTVAGVGKVKVMITLEDAGRAVIEKDESRTRNGSTEVDSAGGSRNTTDITETEKTIYTGSKSGEEIPYVTQMLSPKIAGVLVSAQGGGDASVAGDITDAIQALFGIPSHKIKIVKMIS